MPNSSSQRSPGLNAPSRCDLTKEQRDEHLRRYTELIELQLAQGKPIQLGQVSVGGRGNKSVARIVAENTGLSLNTVKRATGQIAATKPKVVDIKSALEPESDHDAIIREANAIVSAWNRARQEACYWSVGDRNNAQKPRPAGSNWPGLTEAKGSASVLLPCAGKVKAPSPVNGLGYRRG